jgi:transposase-like protein
MPPLSYARHQFPPVVIQHAVWLYIRFTLSFRDVEDLLAERGLAVSYETIRRWVLKFGPATARRLRQRRPKPSPRWHLDEMAVRIAGEPMYPGGRWTTRARCWTSWCSAGGTSSRRGG